MPRTYRLTASVNKAEPEVLTGEIPDDEWGVLEQFLDRVDRLAATNIGAGCNINLNVSFDGVSGEITVTGTLPPQDDVDAFVYRMRPFVLHDESTSFNRVCGIVAKRLPHPGIRAVLKQQQQEFKGKAFQTQLGITSDGVVLNSEETLQLWLNGAGEYHNDPEKRAELVRLHQTLRLEKMRPLYVSMLFDKARAVVEISLIVKGLLGRFPKGTEVRYGHLKI